MNEIFASSGMKDTGKRRDYPDECLPGDWILADTVPDWGPNGISVYVHPASGPEFKKFVRELRVHNCNEKDAWVMKA